jgi:hypothetical protein
MQANPACDRELAELSRTMMAKKPAERPGYDELIAQLSHIVARLDPAAAPMLIATRDRSRPIALPDLDRADEGAGNGAGATNIDDIELPRAGLPGWLVAFTFVCIALFVAGVVVYLRRDGAPVTGSAPEPQPPSGMILVHKPDGAPWFFVDAQPVTAAAFHQLFGSHEQAGSAEDPVVMVSYNDARVYAKTRGGQLLTSDQWDSAAMTPGFRAGDLLEWVASPDDKNRVVRQRGKSAVRPDKEQKDVTFRMAKELQDIVQKP